MCLSLCHLLPNLSSPSSVTAHFVSLYHLLLLMVFATCPMICCVCVTCYLYPRLLSSVVKPTGMQTSVPLPWNSSLHTHIGLCSSVTHSEKGTSHLYTCRYHYFPPHTVCGYLDGTYTFRVVKRADTEEFCRLFCLL